MKYFLFFIIFALISVNIAYGQIVVPPQSSGAEIKLDKEVYTWTDKVIITIIAPDHNSNSNLIDVIGDTNSDPVKVSTRGFDLRNYKLVETGINTGIFTGEVILTGFSTHDADGDGETGDASGAISGDNGGPTDGLLPLEDNDDGITVMFEFSEDETVVSGKIIQWNVGKIQWLESYNVSDGMTNVVRVNDPDMNLNPETVDNFVIYVWSDSDAGGIDITVTETNVATGIFEGTVSFTTTDESSGQRLRVAEGDTVTAEYEDHTLPSPHTINDELDITANLKPVEFADISVNTDKSTYESGQLITVTVTANQMPPSVWEKIDFTGMQIVDELESVLNRITPDQHVYIMSNLVNTQNIDQDFTYLVQIQNSNGDAVSSEWVVGSLSSIQSLRSSHSWVPTETGIYFGKILIWNSIDDMTPLSNMITFTLNVGNGLSSFEDVSVANYDAIPLTLKIQHSEGNIVWIDQIAIQNEEFNVVYSSQGTVWKKSGTYNVVVQQLDKKATTAFELTIPIVCPTGQELIGDTCQTKTCPTGQELIGDTCQTKTCPTGQELIGDGCVDKPKFPVEIVVAVGGSAVGAGSVAAYKIYGKKTPIKPKPDSGNPEDPSLSFDIHVEIRGGLEP